MKRNPTPFAFAAAIASVVTACDAKAPSVSLQGPAIPTSDIPKTASLKGAPLSARSDDAATGECVEWITVEETVDPSGDFRYLYRCTEGGAVAESLIVGHDDGFGNGTYVDTYSMRDGTSVVWTFSYATDVDGVSQTLLGQSEDGQSHSARYATRADGSTVSHEEWTMAEGSYVIDGVYDAAGLFSGTTVFDDPNTSESPDWVATSSQAADGSITQEVSWSAEGWDNAYTLAVAADGASDYTFGYDDTATSANPDFRGSYAYTADGAGHGSYVQRFDDGSTTTVSDVFDAAGNLSESWAFDDASTTESVDQEGRISYAPDGSGSGTVSSHFSDGSTETCDVAVDADGATSISNCRTA